MGTYQLSIIVPLYNVEDYIERCILSIASQPVDTCVYELIVVNDGSTDKSGSIVKRLQDTYPFIKLINQENGGLSSARNKGLDHASGKYIFFVDADDWLVSGSLAKLLKTIDQQQTDIILFESIEVYPGGRTKKIIFHLPARNRTFSVEDYMCDYTLLSAAWQGVFKRSLFTTYGIRMPEGFFAEDDDLVVKVFSIANTLYYFSEEVYNYYQRPQSISNSSDKSHNERLIKDRIFIFQGLAKYIQSFSGKRRRGLERKLDFLALDIIRLLIRKSMSESIINDVLQQLSDFGYFPLRERCYSIKYRIFRTLLKSSSSICFFASLKKSRKFF